MPQSSVSSGRRLPFVQLDVFTTRALEGNALAVFPDATRLDDHEMQAIAREMNLSETTFVFPHEGDGERGVRVRIFTVQEELPFAGHPTLGTAFALRGQSGRPEIRLQLNVGTIPVRFEESSGQPPFGEMTQADPTFGQVHDPARVAEATGIPIADIDPKLPIQTVSTGIPFTVLPLRSLEAAARLHIDQQRASEYLRSADGKFFFCVTRETIDPTARLHARMLFYNGEDPATGSASGCAAAWMVEHGIARSDEHVLIEQGVEMKRPSRIFVRASRRNDRVVNVRVGGNVVEVLRGELFF
ncbi:MAG: PhzF family phenazine biosynthesis protein [Acidobacteria bacterium]|nr:PhzF family phenazine biosynthesis protein [Acidobacteriota bacterium]MBV9623709.1 PhzF family phenazine biosynthesis protein [Acidobacteriota bacterium]